MRNEVPLDSSCFTYQENFLPKEEANALFAQLLEELDWQEKEITLYGKTHKQPRLIAWYSKKSYTYSKETLPPTPFPKILLELKAKIEQQTGALFNSVLCNLYRNQKDSMGEHSDDELELGQEPVIASLSLGAQRDFIIRHKFHNTKTTLALQSGSLLLMHGTSQVSYTHALPLRAKPFGPRINLTFRNIRS